MARELGSDFVALIPASPVFSHVSWCKLLTIPFWGAGVPVTRRDDSLRFRIFVKVNKVIVKVSKVMGEGQ